MNAYNCDDFTNITHPKVVKSLMNEIHLKYRHEQVSLQDLKEKNNIKEDNIFKDPWNNKYPKQEIVKLKEKMLGSKEYVNDRNKFIIANTNLLKESIAESSKQINLPTQIKEREKFERSLNLYERELVKEMESKKSKVRLGIVTLKESIPRDKASTQNSASNKNKASHQSSHLHTINTYGNTSNPQVNQRVGPSRNTLKKRGSIIMFNTIDSIRENKSRSPEKMLLKNTEGSSVGRRTKPVDENQMIRNKLLKKKKEFVFTFDKSNNLGKYEKSSFNISKLNEENIQTEEELKIIERMYSIGNKVDQQDKSLQQQSNVNSLPVLSKKSSGIFNENSLTRDKSRTIVNKFEDEYVVMRYENDYTEFIKKRIMTPFHYRQLEDNNKRPSVLEMSIDDSEKQRLPDSEEYSYGIKSGKIDLKKLFVKTELKLDEQVYPSKSSFEHHYSQKRGNVLDMNRLMKPLNRELRKQSSVLEEIEEVKKRMNARPMTKNASQIKKEMVKKKMDALNGMIADGIEKIQDYNHRIEKTIETSERNIIKEFFPLETEKLQEKILRKRKSSMLES